jgi:diguanylate cyclase (GGDEF)-like protein
MAEPVAPVMAGGRASWLVGLLLGHDPEMQRRLRLCLMAATLYVMWAIGFTVWGLMQPSIPPMIYLFLLNDLGGVAFYLFARAGLTRRMRDPALVLPQMLYAGGGCALAYLLLPSLRPGVLQLACLVQVFGLFNLRPRQLRISGFATVAMLLAAAAASVALNPAEAVASVARQALAGAMILGFLTLVCAHHAEGRSRLRTTRLALAQAVQRTELLATRDALTGLPNRQHARDQLSVDLARHDEGGPPVCIAFLDLDHFKNVNDMHGHAAGDAVLQRFAEVARGQLRDIDLLARWGGEEFLLVLRDTASAEAAVSVLARIRARLDESPFQVGEASLRIGFSAGMAARVRGETLDQTVQRADEALYRAKALGRGRTEIGVPGASPEAPVTQGAPLAVAG